MPAKGEVCGGTPGMPAKGEVCGGTPGKAIEQASWCACCVVLMRMLGGLDAHAAWC